MPILKRAANALYGLYAWLALLACVLPTCVLLAVTPGLQRRRTIARVSARAFFAAIGSPVRVEGAAIERHYPCIVVANHASYLDGIILTAALPASFTYLIKQEMTKVPIAGFLLRRLGSAFVDRNVARDRRRIARELVERAIERNALGFFPEGTFDEKPGLRPFQLGAFSAAARGRLPIVPVVIYGARRKLPAGRFLCSPGPLRVRICEPVAPRDAATARALMAATRAAMLRHLDEPDLEPLATSGPDHMSA
jgi:1-acyl-sn-glycerol-3-phosphate acyltransferase